MNFLTGEYECKLDTNRRMMIPGALKKKLPNVETEGLVINRGFEKQLVIYTRQEWNKKLEELSKLNEYEPKNIKFIRSFTGGATELLPDSNGRVNIPQPLLEYAGIKADVVLTCLINKIEMWDKEAYMALQVPEDYSAMAKEVMGEKPKGIQI